MIMKPVWGWIGVIILQFVVAERNMGLEYFSLEQGEEISLI